MAGMRRVLAAGLAAGVLSQDAVLKLTMINQTDYPMSACLDGTAPGFYFEPGVGLDAYNFLIYFQGGGWCYDAGDCYGRAHTNLGSSKAWPATMTLGGLMGAASPFANWSKIALPYCDGNSFSGMRDLPVSFNGMNLYFRGRYNLDAALDSARRNTQGAAVPFSSAYDVLLTGCSAGGLSTYLHADYVAGQIPAVRPPPPGGPSRNGIYRVVPISGFFLDSPNVDGAYIYRSEIQTIHYLANSSAGTNEACVRGEGPGNEWKCNMAQYVYRYLQSPIFALNSLYDSWSTGCILTAEPVSTPNDTSHNGNCSAVPGWASCAGNPEACTTPQMAAYNNWRANFIAAFNQTTTAQATGNGAFLVSCHTHCEGQSDSYFMNFAINGVTMAQAVHSWYASDSSEPAAMHTYFDCEYNTNGTHACNPSCAA